MSNKKKLKDLEYLDYKIRIKRIKEHYKEGSSHTLKPKLICVSIDTFNSRTSTAFKDNKKGKKELLQFLKQEIL